MILLQKLRLQRGLSQRQLGRACMPEVDAAYISRAERQGLRLYPSQVQRVAAALDWDGNPSELFEEVTDASER